MKRGHVKVTVLWNARHQPMLLMFETLLSVFMIDGDLNPDGMREFAKPITSEQTCVL